MILYQDTIHAVNANDYSSAQLGAWAPIKNAETTTSWKTLLANISYVAAVNKVSVLLPF